MKTGRKPNLRPGLRPREREVLELLVAGKQGKEIAEAMGISLYTAWVYFGKIREKYRATSVQAASLLFQQGVEPPLPEEDEED